MPQNIHPSDFMYMHGPSPYHYDPETYMLPTQAISQGCMSAYCCYRAPVYVANMPPPLYEDCPSSHYYPPSMPQRHGPQSAKAKNSSQKENSDDDRYDNVKIKLNNLKNDQKEEF